ncbi:MAG: S-methyl-5-thioribose-1-phosphate isomerase [bacterium]|nr:MAG: S-methyl-5-thioribose-1-phosphate isomerase [bacterium]
MKAIQPIRWDPDAKQLILLDQSLLPAEEVYRGYSESGEVAEAIRSLVVRGAPAIGCTAAFGVVLAAYRYTGSEAAGLGAVVAEAMDDLAGTRPTAVNLFWALDRMGRTLAGSAGQSCGAIRSELEREALAIYRDDLAACREMGDLGAGLVPESAKILTHCNAGALATAGYGTALGVVRSAFSRGKVSMVWVDETRPVLQGARLTAWEMVREGIPATLITDSMAGALMAAGDVDLVVVGADRIAANGDVANKIGTYSIAVLAHHHGIPFVVAAPISTVDLSLVSGGSIPIEERERDEVIGFRSEVWAPEQVRVYNPAFDVTPAELVTAIVTERGIVRPPFGPALSEILRTG